MISPGKFHNLCRLAADRFNAKLAPPSDPDVCWEWTGANDGRRGYGKFKIDTYESARTHRIAYAIAVGPIPAEMDVLHRCDNPKCCNPNHLFLGRHNENMSDMVRKGRSKGGSPRGERAHNAKLTQADVDLIKVLITAGHRNTEIAPQFGVGDDTISRIRRGRAWGSEPMQAKYASLRR